MEHKIYLLKINEKRDELNKLIEKNNWNLLTDKILKVSKELDKLICSYYSSS